MEQVVNKNSETISKMTMSMRRSPLPPPFSPESHKPTPVPEAPLADGEQLVPELLLGVRDPETAELELLTAVPSADGDRIFLKSGGKVVSAIGTVSAGSALVVPRVGELKPQDDPLELSLEPNDVTVQPHRDGLLVTTLPDGFTGLPTEADQVAAHREIWPRDPARSTNTPK